MCAWTRYRELRQQFRPLWGPVLIKPLSFSNETEEARVIDLFDKRVLPSIREESLEHRSGHRRGSELVFGDDGPMSCRYS